MYCVKCGKMIPETARFCPYCGQSMKVFLKQEILSVKQREWMTAPDRSRRSETFEQSTLHIPEIAEGVDDKRKTVAAIVSLVVALLFIWVAFQQGNYQSRLPGTWINESGSVVFVLYNDGTCEIAGEYGTGRWTVDDENIFKISNWYGKTETGKIKSLYGRRLILTNGTDESILYRK